VRGGELTYGDGEVGMLLYNNTSHAIERKVVWCRFAKKNWLSYAVRIFSLDEIKGRALMADAWLGIKCKSCRWEKIAASVGNMRA